MSAHPPLLQAALVGRARELTMFRELLANAERGTGGLALLVGVPGIGKTRLLEEFVRLARASGAEVLTGRCFEGPGAPAFWPWVQIVRAYMQTRDEATLIAELGAGAADVAAVVPELGGRFQEGLATPPQVGQDQARFRFFDATTRALVAAAEARPIAIVLDDLHGADRSSLMLLQFLARMLRTSRVIVVATLRDVALEPGHPLVETLGEIVREQVSVQLEITGLDVREVAELMESMAGPPAPPPLAETIHARTEGNPLYVTEVVRMLLAQGGLDAAGGEITIPATVRATIARHLGTLSAPSRRTLTVAALFGREFQAEIVARAAGEPIDAVLAHLDEAIGARVVGVRAGERRRYRFAHALFGETLLEALGEARRVALHRHAAGALAVDPLADEFAAEIAHHWFAAGRTGEPAEAVLWSRRAADRAMRMLAFEEAREWYRRALTALDWTGADAARTRADVLVALGDAANRSGAIAEAKEAFQHAAALARALGSTELLTQAALGYAPAVTYGQHPAPDPSAVELLEEAIANWHGRDSSLHSRALAKLSEGLLFGDAERREACGAAAVDMARRVDDPAALRFALVARLDAYRYRHDVETRLELATELVRLADRARDYEALAAGRIRRCTHLMEQGDIAGADAEIAAFVCLAEELRQPVWDWYVPKMRAMRHLVAGRFAEAEHDIHEAFAIGKHVLPYAAPVFFAAQMMGLGLLRGSPDGHQRPDPIDEYRSLMEHHPDPAAVSPLVWAEAEAGRLGEVKRLVDRLAADDFSTVRRCILPLVAGVCLAEGCAALEDTERAAALYEMLGPYRPYWTQWTEGMPFGPASHALGLLARTLGRFDEAASHFAHAVQQARHMRADPFLARALHEWAVLHRMRGAKGDREQAGRLLDEARHLAEALGMRGLSRKIAALDEARGQRTAPGRRTERGAGGPSSGDANVFEHEGEYWTLAYGGVAIRLRDTKGLRYVAHLLAHPGRDVHVADLSTLDMAPEDAKAGSPTRQRDLGAVLDPQATAAYKRRLAELRDELDEATERGDLGRASQAREEIEAIAHGLSAAYGLGGRARKAGDPAERVRKAVTNQIHRAVARIQATHPALGRHLANSLRTGFLCAYRPEQPVAWSL